MNSDSVKFHVLEDDDESIIPDERTGCKIGCGRRLSLGLDRMLREPERCCIPCSESNGKQHTPHCDKRTLSGSIKDHACNRAPEASSLLMSHSASRLIDDLPDPGIDLDPVVAKCLLDALCDSNDLPRLDEKRFLLVFSRFAKGNHISSFDARRFLCVAFRRVYKSVRVDTESPLLPRYFFVVKNKNVERHYRFKSVIGRGSFGIVHKVIHFSSGQQRVCKSILKKSTSLPSHQLESEIRIIAQLDHPNVIRMYEFFEDESAIHIIMEYCSGGDILGKIKESIKSGRRISSHYIRSVLQQVLRSIAFMHERRVLHKDLKPENIMLVPSDERDGLAIVKVIDFGLSEIFSKDQEISNTVAGTAFYMAPEIFRPPFNHKCDVWSCGVIAFFLSTGFLPFFGSTVAEVKSNVLYRRLQWPTTFAGTSQVLDLHPNFKSFVERLLEKDPSLRPNAVDALLDPWLCQSDGHHASILFSRAIVQNIRCFSKLSFIKRAIINLIAHVWHFREFENIIRTFSSLDTANTGFITTGSLARALQDAGVPALDSLEAAKSLDLTSSGVITYTAFTAGVILPLLDSDKRITRCAFDSFNPTKGDYISTRSMWDVISGNRGALKPPTSKSSASYNRFVEQVAIEFGIPTYTGNRESETDETESDVISFSVFRDWLLADI